MKDCNELLRLLADARRIYIQTHDFPDHDSVACAYALQKLLAGRGFSARITYTGDIQRESLHVMIGELGIQLARSERYSICSRDRVIIVDGCKGNRNVSHLPAPELAVIDHHAVSQPEDIPYFDIRADYGACATIIHEYYRQLNAPISTAVATALIIGISMDTAQLTRGAGSKDIDAYSDLYPLADTRLLNSVMSSYIESADLSFYRTALDNVRVGGRFAFCYLPDGCSQNLMGIIADFFMALRDVDFAVLCARNNDRVNLSARSRSEAWNASLILQTALEGIGMGGGHRHMAGGSIRDLEIFDVIDVYRRFCAGLGIVPDQDPTPAAAFESPIRILQTVTGSRGVP